MRGAVAELAPSLSSIRIIPAHAGSSRQVGAIYRAGWDHPRACGEQLVAQSRIFRNMGSSPRMRGAGYLIRSIFF